MDVVLVGVSWTAKGRLFMVEQFLTEGLRDRIANKFVNTAGNCGERGPEHPSGEIISNQHGYQRILPTRTTNFFDMTIRFPKNLWEYGLRTDL
ncbi:hypothetical protein BHYA_0008g00050 [Botrytis hyacinthi]|uniref:Uncharacterized protein n=1 Tax=Botrytis hyacinthi TaxID=278943 RepID=A0A4Z1GZW8_9HELO|nr:hypothetical protein BHYA_0008g00050 [Botrytis hyacinthi]